MKTITESPQETIGRLETELTRIIAGRAEMLLAIDQRLRAAQMIITGLVESPAADKVAAGIAAHTEIEFLNRLRADVAEYAIGNPMKLMRSRDAWFEQNSTVLAGALTAILDEKSAGQAAFKDASAERQGRLTAAAVRAQGTPGEAAADDALAVAENDLYEKELLLSTARTQLRALQTDVTYAGWLRAREAVKNVSFELPPEADETNKR